MAIKHLTDEQIRTWTREQKDRWWLENVFRGDMPQLTIRSALTGFCLGGILSATNLYVGAKTGWTLGVGITSVILAFAMFKILSRLGAREFTILENNCMQSIATAAGYMTGPLISGMAAYMWVQNELLPWWQIFWFNVVLSVLGVLVAFPLKRRFINDEQQPFPEGRACGVVLDTLHSSDASVGIFKAKVLGTAAALAGVLTFLMEDSYLKALRALWYMARTGQSWGQTLTEKAEQIKETWHLPHYLDEWYYWMVAKGWAATPKLSGVDIRQLGLRPAMDLAMIGAGGLMGMRTAASMLIGMIINFVILVPIMIAVGEIAPLKGSFETGDAVFTRAHVLNVWALWWGIVMMVVASLFGLFARPKVIVSAFTGLFAKRRTDGEDPLRHIELPLWISFVGIPIIGAIGVWMSYAWFGVRWEYGATAIMLIIVLTLIAANSTALTGITPTGPLSKIPQFLYGGLNPAHPGTNLMTAAMCTEVASNASNLLMDIKPGYMLGAKPRQQAIGHTIGIFAGALASTPLFYLLFLSNYKEGQSVQEAMVTDQFAFPSAVQWKGVSDLVVSIFGEGSDKSLLTPSIIWSMVIAGVVALVFEALRVATRGRFPISPLAIGLGVVIPPESTFAMFLGALFFWLMGRIYGGEPATGSAHDEVGGMVGSREPQSLGHRLWIGAQEPICAGLIAGAALVGIGATLVKVFALSGLE